MKANNKLYLRKDTRAQVGIGTLIIFIAMVLVAAVAAAVLIQTSGVLQQKAQSTGKQATQEVSSNLIIKSIEGVRAKNSSENAATIDLLKLKIGLNVGSAPVDVNQVVVSITDGTTANNLVYGYNSKSYAVAADTDGRMDNFEATAALNAKRILFNSTIINSLSTDNADHYYACEKIRDEDESFSQTNPVMNTGDLVTFYLATTSGTSVAANYYTVGDYEIANTHMKDSKLDLVTRTTISIVLTPEAGAATTADFVTPSSYGVKETVQLYP